nr:ATP-binding protein [Cyanobium sp. LEGE 06143]
MPTANHVQVIQRDNRTGIHSEHFPHLFERFYPVEKARSRALGGTGHGLAIAQEIVHRHRGE